MSQRESREDKETYTLLIITQCDEGSDQQFRIPNSVISEEERTVLQEAGRQGWWSVEDHGAEDSSEKVACHRQVVAHIDGGENNFYDAGAAFPAGKWWVYRALDTMLCDISFDWRVSRVYLVHC
jgi:hypothetical protein